MTLLVPAVVSTCRPPDGRAKEQPARQTPIGRQGLAVTPEALSATFQGTVAEVIDAGRHMYVLVDTGKQQVWVAVPAFAGRPGDQVLVPPGVPAANFQSKKLNRYFKMMIFVGAIRRIVESPTK